jgi:hypothetical protein
LPHPERPPAGWQAETGWAQIEAAAPRVAAVMLGAHFSLDVVAGAGLGMLVGGMLNLVFGVPSASSNTPCADGLR